MIIYSYSYRTLGRLHHAGKSCPSCVRVDASGAQIPIAAHMEAGNQKEGQSHRGRQLVAAMRCRTGSFATLDTADNATRETEVVAAHIHDRGELTV